MAPHRWSALVLFGLYALVATVWGWRLARAIAFPFVLFIFSVPVTGTTANDGVTFVHFGDNEDSPFPGFRTKGAAQSTAA